MLDFLDRFLGLCERLFTALANACLGIMLASNALNILSRAVFDKAIDWVFPYSMVLFVWLVFIGFYVFVRKGRSISVDFVLNRLTGLPHKILRLFINIAVLIVLGVILSAVPKSLHEQVGELEMVGIQRYWLTVPLFLSCALICLHAVVDSARLLVSPSSSAGEKSA